MSEVAAWELRRRQSVSEQLKKIGVSAGVLQRMARAGQLIKLQCETPKCYCDKGRRFFPDPPVPNSPWGPTIDHYPILKSLGGTKTPENVRLAHKRCNNEDFAWRERWTPTSVRWMFVTG